MSLVVYLIKGSSISYRMFPLISSVGRETTLYLLMSGPGCSRLLVAEYLAIYGRLIVWPFRIIEILRDRLCIAGRIES